jgi:NitT/TauT family transport system substrate-binding protein
LKKGFYKQAGLDVKIVGGLGSFSNVQLAAQGQADIVHAASGPMTIAASKGANIKMIASFIQEGGSGIATIPSIKSPHDMIGKSFFGLSFDYTTVLLPQYEQIVGISGIKTVTSNSSSTIQPLLDGSVDMIAATGWAEVPELKALGFKFNYFSYAKVGFNLIGPGLVVNGSWLTSHRAAAKAFALASARGWQYALRHQAEAVAIMNKAYPQTNPKFTAAIMRNFKGYTHTPASKRDPLGYMELSDWKHTEAVLQKANLISNVPAPTSLFVNLIPKNSPYR